MKKVLGGSEWVSAHPIFQILGDVVGAAVVALLCRMMGFDSWYGR